MGVGKLPACDYPHALVAQSASFDVALSHRQRANGPAIYLAQPEGLGFQYPTHLQLTGGLLRHSWVCCIAARQSKTVGVLVTEFKHAFGDQLFRFGNDFSDRFSLLVSERFRLERLDRF